MLKAVRFSQFRGPEVLAIVDLPDSHPGPGQVRIAVRAAGVNPSDWKRRKGLMDGELPQTLGYEAVGVVDELGEGVADVAVGDRVFGFSAEGAAQAELAVLSYYAPIPPSLDFSGAAALPAAIETATRALAARRRARCARDRHRQSGQPRVPSLAGGRACRLRRGPRRAGSRARLTASAPRSTSPGAASRPSSSSSRASGSTP
jgi:NADPH:quinone reductase-like Zn-dependent oxidoreductase